MRRARQLCRWSLYRTPRGWSLFFRGDLVASADDPAELFALCATLTTNAPQ